MPSSVPNYHPYYGSMMSYTSQPPLYSSTPTGTENGQDVGAIEFPGFSTQVTLGGMSGPNDSTPNTSIRLPQSEPDKLFAQHQEGCRKDIERAFGVLQARFKIIREPTRMWDITDLAIIMGDSAGKCVRSDAVITEGFSRWNNFKSFSEHVGGVDSFHNNAVMKCENLMKQGQSIEHALHKQDDITRNEFRIRLNASVDASKYLLRQGLPFRGHDESEKSANRGNFVELLKYTADQNEVVSKVILDNAPGNNQMTSPKIQKDIVHCFAEEVVKSIIEEIDHDVFGLLVDESADVSDKEQMAVVFRFVDKNGIVKERFMSITHVSETSATSLKSAIDGLFAKYGLSIKKVRGQGYDGASNMKGEFNGLKSLILRKCSLVYYVHCFAHQLQLVVVAVAKKHFNVGDFFDMISLLMNVVGGSCKRKDMIRESYRKKIQEEINNGEISTGTGLNQEISLQRPGTTRWNSHYNTLLRLIQLFSCIVKVLEYIENEGVDDLKRRQAHGLLNYFHSFDFVFYLQMMIHLLGLTESLSMALQRRDQDILNAMSLVKSTKRQLQNFRDDGWNSLMMKVSLFCEKHEIEKIEMEADYVDSKRPRKRTGVSNMHHYKINSLYVVLDLQLQEFNDRFNEVNTELLICAASLSPIDAFSEFDHSKLLRLSKFYSDDFSSGEFISLEQELDIYIDNVRHDERFSTLKNLGDLARMLVETRKRHILWFIGF
ncbi:Ribonuclease H-like superfamily [Arabidopsis suecica]|uniref:Ribonuclease H-like superfamily n=1 Tax=Arabidopsis suecica TaxID=45249 RepID=A0A8T2BAP7_ARASU|nr:Ribonuclease H-like superfamily [Arabidopsis suecica]